jgi:YggT family protein
MEVVMSAIGSLLLWALQIYSFVMLARVLMTWLGPNLDYTNPIVRFLFQATEPVLKPIREKLPPMQGIDLSPLVVFLGIMVLSRIIGSVFF